MNSVGTNYIIQGQTFTKMELQSFCKQKIGDSHTAFWEKEIYSFIVSWVSTSKTIKVHTSGSTGQPKDILLHKKFMLASAQATIDFFRLKPGDSALLCLPVKYIAGKMMIVRAMAGGMNLNFTSPATTLELEMYDNIDFCAMVPNQLASFLDDKNGAVQLEKIRTLIIGGSFLPKILEEKLKNLKTSAWQTYGMTETITHIALRKISGNNTNEWYTPLPGVSVETDHRGCLVVSSEKIGVNELATNDLAEISAQGTFKLLGRIDNVVISGGVKLFPEHIEEKLAGWISNPYYMAGLTDDKLGQRLVLYIEDDGRLKNQIFKIWKKIEEKLSSYEIPKEIIFREHFQRTESGKIVRE